ncbi:MAG: hypothetical protein ACOZNI_06795 [Myxococcota bacterium]
MWGLLVACVGADAVVEAAGVPGPTWHADVAPVVVRECAACHRADGIAPFPLTSYDEAAPVADAMAAATAERSMPPFNLDNSGACNTFADARWLTDEEIATLGDWARAGAPEGTPPDVPPEAPAHWTLDRVDLTLEMAEAYTPDASLEDDYRCFVLDPGLAEDRFVTGFGVRPGEPRMVHHLTLFALDSEEAEQDAEALDEAEPGSGYTCFGDTVVPSRWLVGSGPGDAGGAFPEGTGLRMSAGRKTVLQMHYNRAAGTWPDRTAVDLKLEASVPAETRMERVAVTDLELPPGEPVVEASDAFTLGADHTVWGVWPHMHGLGTALRVVATRPDGETCLARVDDYAFHWQAFEFYEAPVELHEGDRVELTCTWDTTGRDTTTTWGTGTDDEMCIAFFYVTQR